MDLLTKRPMFEAIIPVIDPDSYDDEDSYVYGIGVPVDGMTYTLAGKTSPEFRAAVREAEKQEVAEDKGIDLYAGAITNWTGFEENGVVLDCDMDTKRRILRRYDWILEQVIVTLKKRSVFFPNARNAYASPQPSALGAQPKSAK